MKKEFLLYCLVVVLGVVAAYHAVYKPLTTEPAVREFPAEATVFKANPETGEWDNIWGEQDRVGFICLGYQTEEHYNLTAIPATGWQFDHWEGGASGVINPVTIVITGDKEVTAVFTRVSDSSVARSLTATIILDSDGDGYPDSYAPKKI